MKDDGMMNRYATTCALIVFLGGLTICKTACAEPGAQKTTVTNQSAGNIDAKQPETKTPAGVIPAPREAQSEQTQDKSSGSLIRVGIYDSRALAVSHGQSDEYQSKMRQLRVDAKKARADGDEKKARQFDKQLSVLMGPIRAQAHSTRPIGDILETVKGMIPGVAEEAKVDMIVSKWAIVYERPDIEYVDVTDLMVKTFFDPKESTLTSIKNILMNDPVPLHKFQ